MELKMKYLLTVAIICLNCLHAMCFCSIYITFLDFVEIIGTSLENIVIGITVRNCTICVGSLLSAIVYARFNRRVVFSSFIILEALITASMPHVENYGLHIVLNALLGFCGGALEAACFALIAELWKEKANPMIHTLTLAMDIALVATPVIMSPFLSSTEPENDKEGCGSRTIASNFTLHLNSTVNTNSAPHSSRIWLPFLALTGVMIIGAYLTIVLECYRVKVNSKNDNNKKKCSEVSTESVAKSVPPSYKIPFLILSCLMMAIIWGYVTIFFQFWITFVIYSKLKLSKARGAHMISVFSFAGTVGCFVGVFASIKFKPMLMLSILTAIIAIGNCFLFSSAGPEILWWIGGTLISFSTGSYYSFQYNLAQERIGITGTVNSLYTVFAYLLTALGVPILLASLIKCYPQVFVYYNTSSVAVMVILLISLAVLDKFKYPKGERETHESKEELSLPLEFTKRLSVRRISLGGMPL